MLIALPPPEMSDLDTYFLRMFEEGASLRDGALSSTQLDVLLAVGPYPVTMVEMAERVGLEEAERRMMDAAELAGRFVSEGRADAIGEVGRPHFKVPGELMEASNRIMEACMREARSAGCPVILHTEDPTPESMLDLSGIASRAGIDRGRVIKHHCTDLIGPGENHGLFPSIMATRDIVFSAAGKGTRFMMETDYIDDPSNPGAFMGIGTVPRRTRELVERGVLTEDDVWKVNGDNPARMYGREVLAGRGR